MNLNPTQLEHLIKPGVAFQRLCDIANDYLSHNTMTGDQAAYDDLINIASILANTEASLAEAKLYIAQLTEALTQTP